MSVVVVELSVLQALQPHNTCRAGHCGLQSSTFLHQSIFVAIGCGQDSSIDSLVQTDTHEQKQTLPSHGASHQPLKLIFSLQQQGVGESSIRPVERQQSPHSQMQIVAPLNKRQFAKFEASRFRLETIIGSTRSSLMVIFLICSRQGKNVCMRLVCSATKTGVRLNIVVFRGLTSVPSAHVREVILSVRLRKPNFLWP